MKIGVYSGSFNPVHVGHIALADYMVEEHLVDQVWLIRSPQNPLKQAEGLMSNEDRLNMLTLAIEGHEGLQVCTVEDNLPLPNYTIVTLQTLQSQYPEHEFHLIIGADNWLIFQKWKDWQIILRDYHLMIYPRPGFDMPKVPDAQYSKVRFVDAPLYEVSSTEIRNRLSQGLSLNGLVDPKVEQYLSHDAAKN